MKLYLTLLFTLISLASFGQDIEKVLKSDPFQFSGSVTGRTGFANAQGIADRTSPFHYMLATKLNFTFYGFDVPLYFSIRNNSYQYGTSIPRFKIRPRYKWVELQIGDVVPKMNPYVADNRNVRGVGIRLTPGKFRFQATYGKMRELRSFRDTLLIGTIDDQVFSRPTASLTLGYGNTRNFADLYLVRSWDDQDKAFYLDRNTTAKSNTIVGTTIKLKLFKGFSFSSNLGMSILTQNINALGNTESFYKNNVTGSLVDLNASSNLNFAGDAGFHYRFKKVGINAKVRYIQPHYQPLTVAYINTDLLDYTIGGTLSLFRNKVYLNSRVGIQSNNISKVDEITNKRWIFNVLGKWQITPKFSTTLMWNNYTTNLEAKSIQINELYTFSINNQMRSIGIQFRNPKKVNQFYFTIRGGQSDFTTVSSNESNGDYTSLFTRGDLGYELESYGLDIRLGMGFNQYNRSNIQTNTTTFNSQLSKSIFNKKVTFNLINSYTMIDVESLREGTNLLNHLAANWRLNKQNNLSIQIMRLKRSSYINPTFTEWRSFITARHLFGTQNQRK